MVLVSNFGISFDQQLDLLYVSITFKCHYGKNSLEDCTLEEQRAFNRFLVTESVKPSEIVLSRMLMQYGKSYMNCAPNDRFKGGRIRVGNHPRSGSPV